MTKLMRAIGTALLPALLMLGTTVAQSAAIFGEVRKIDEAAGKITLKHGPAKSLGMGEPMTMVYRGEALGGPRASVSAHSSTIFHGIRNSRHRFLLPLCSLRRMSQSMSMRPNY